MSDFINQGGYGFYVWSAYGVSAVAIAALIAWVLLGWRQAKARVAASSGEGDGAS